MPKADMALQEQEGSSWCSERGRGKRNIWREGPLCQGGWSYILLSCCLLAVLKVQKAPSSS